MTQGGQSASPRRVDRTSGDRPPGLRRWAAAGEGTAATNVDALPHWPLGNHLRVPGSPGDSASRSGMVIAPLLEPGQGVFAADVDDVVPDLLGAQVSLERRMVDDLHTHTKQGRQFLRG